MRFALDSFINLVLMENSLVLITVTAVLIRCYHLGDRVKGTQEFFVLFLELFVSVEVQNEFNNRNSEIQTENHRLFRKSVADLNGYLKNF